MLRGALIALAAGAVVVGVGLARLMAGPMSDAARIETPAELRLFPLEIVLFPGATLPLRVFESRYRQLVAECVDEGAPFGVVLIAEGHSVGDANVDAAERRHDRAHRRARDGTRTATSR